MNYSIKSGFNLYQSRHCAYITYTVKTWFLKNLSVSKLKSSTGKDTFNFGLLEGFKKKSKSYILDHSGSFDMHIENDKKDVYFFLVVRTGAGGGGGQ